MVEDSLFDPFFSFLLLIEQNYGAYFELAPTGIVGGPVKLIGNGNQTKDLSANTWTYRV